MQTTESATPLSQLESHVWESAKILHSQVGAADSKTYIFSLLFYKRICDVWDEVHQDLVDETSGGQLAQFSASHRFQIPKDCRWKDIRTKEDNLGAALERAMLEIERANPHTLSGIFGYAQWSRLPDSLLKKLMERFSKIPLGNKDINPDLLGEACENLIQKFAETTNTSIGEFYTPRSVVRLMINILDPKETDTIYDPACGTGGMLLAAFQHVKKGNVQRLWGKLYGQEKNPSTAAIARMNLFLHGLEDFQVVRGDTLRNPAFFEGHRLATFDCVLANPPFSLRGWGEEFWKHDSFGRDFAGLPPSSSGDFAWVQHMIESMAHTVGRMAVVLPQGVLFRKGAEGYIRQNLLEMDLIEAVIGLAPKLFYGTSLAACIMVFRKRKLAAHKNKVLIADASRLFRRGRAQNYLEPEHAAQILGWYRGFADVADMVRVVSLEEIQAEDWTLNISRYVLPPLQEDTPPLPEAMASFKEAAKGCREAEERLAQVMKEGGWLQ